MVLLGRVAVLLTTVPLVMSCAARQPPAPAAASPGPARSAVAEVALTPAVCEGAGRRREFDFWLGRWEVRGAKGAVVGHNRIEAMHGGCALLESWTSLSGVAGTSLNFFDPVRGKWRQLWLDRTAGLIELEGGLAGAAMVLEGTSLQPDGTLGKMRGTWTPMTEGTVRQVFEESKDGTTWRVTFDGLYSRQP